MNIVLIEHVAQGPGREISIDDACFHLDRDLELAVFRVEMRWFVIVVVHDDHNSEEPTDYGHASMIPRVA